MRKILAPLLGSIIALSCTVPALAAIELYDEPVVNDHPGFLSARNQRGDLDKVLVIVPGFDTENDSTPLDDLQDDFAVIDFWMGVLGWDVVVFEYVDGAIDLKHNAENLAQFIEYLDREAGGDYHLALVGGSMGGMVVRTMFAQENDNMGVETFVSLDSPHRGVVLSEWVADAAEQVVDYVAARQMYHGHPDYEEHYGGLEKAEATADFRQRVIGPVDTLAIALSDGSGEWTIRPRHLLLHNEFYPVSSYVDAAGLRSTYMPYHSTAFLDDPSTEREPRGTSFRYRYRDLTSSYFDQVIGNEADEHGAPEYSWLQALQFLLEHEPQEQEERGFVMPG